MTDAGERFQKAVAEHELTIIRDEGLYRHLRLSKPNSFAYGFHITTWPGYLAISGDIGCYVFARLPDMFNFFRGDEINPSYWSEKLQAADRHSGVKEFSQDLFHAAIKSDFDQWSFDSDEERAKAWAALQDSDLAEDGCPDSLHDAITTALKYKCPVSENRFTDFWDHCLQDYTFRFLFCCHAVQWAIGKYDAEKAPVSPATETV